MYVYIILYVTCEPVFSIKKFKYANYYQVRIWPVFADTVTNAFLSQGNKWLIQHMYIVHMHLAMITKYIGAYILLTTAIFT